MKFFDRLRSHDETVLFAQIIQLRVRGTNRAIMGFNSFIELFPWSADHIIYYLDSFTNEGLIDYSVAKDILEIKIKDINCLVSKV